MGKAERNEINDQAEIHELYKNRVKTEKADAEKAARINISSKDILKYLDWNEDGDAEIFVRLHRDKFIYDTAAAQWYVWGGHYWKPDLLEEHLAKISGVIGVYVNEAQHQAAMSTAAAKAGKTDASKAHEGIRKKLHTRIFCLHTDRRKKSVLNQTRRGQNSLAIIGNEWDKNPMLLGCQNGVIDLKTGKSRDGRPDDFIKTVCATTWEGLDEPCPRWKAFISEIFVKEEDKRISDAELAAYVKRLLGYGITGSRVERVFPIFWGRSQNGKGTLFELLKFVLGDLAHKCDSELLLKQKFDKQANAPNPVIAAFRGKRLVWASETEEGRRLNCSKLKELAGGDTLNARELYAKRAVEFTPTHLIFLMTNSKPHAPSGSDEEALWERIHLIPFFLSFVSNPKKDSDRKRDKYLAEKLEKEISGILAWLVQGCLNWQKDGLNPAQAVVDSTEEYRKGENLLESFEEDCCNFDKFDSEVQASIFYATYKKWCEDMRHKPLTGTKFGREMKKRHKSDSSRRHVFYKGFALKTEDESTDQGSGKAKT